MREGIKLSRRLASSESFAKYKGEEIFPGDAIQTDDELDEYIRNVRNFQKHSMSVLQVFSIIFFFLMTLQDFYLSLLHLIHLQSAHTSNALVGTCKMGVSADPLSVVATDLRVHGLKGDFLPYLSLPLLYSGCCYSMHTFLLMISPLHYDTQVSALLTRQ